MPRESSDRGSTVPNNRDHRHDPSHPSLDLRSLSYPQPDLIRDAHNRSNGQENFAYYPAYATGQRLQAARRRFPGELPGAPAVDHAEL